MTEISIDNSKLPGVKEVCRDFAVLEDHTLAHSLQEQEIEHHLATNIQRNRLVKTDLQVAKQLQEEEEIQAKSRNKTHPRDLELLDCEIAQEIQDKLVIEAERRRRQEEKDEDIARLLQEKEEKRRRKYCSSSPAAQEDPYYLDHEGHRSKGVRDSPHRKHPAGVRNQEEKDADLAKRLQERERKANMVDFQAAQLAQDEEIARYLMEKEEKAYKKSKGREKMPDKRRPEEWEPNMHDHMRPRSREGHEQHRSRSDKPYRPLPPPPPDGDDDRDHDYVNLSQHHSPRSNPKSQSSHKGSYYKQ